MLNVPCREYMSPYGCKDEARRVTCSTARSYSEQCWKFIEQWLKLDLAGQQHGCAGVRLAGYKSSAV